MPRYRLCIVCQSVRHFTVLHIQVCCLAHNIEIGLARLCYGVAFLVAAKMTLQLVTEQSRPFDVLYATATAFVVATTHNIDKNNFKIFLHKNVDCELIGTLKSKSLNTTRTKPQYDEHYYRNPKFGLIEQDSHNAGSLSSS